MISVSLRLSSGLPDPVLRLQLGAGAPLSGPFQPQRREPARPTRVPRLLRQDRQEARQAYVTPVLCSSLYTFASQIDTYLHAVNSRVLSFSALISSTCARFAFSEYRLYCCLEPFHILLPDQSAEERNKERERDNPRPPFLTLWTGLRHRSCAIWYT